jgi:ribosomal protein S27E
MRFEIGQEVWRASWDSTTAYVTCPDCGGTGRLRVTFHDETQVSIGCQNCAPGYDPPTGRVRVYERHARAFRSVVTGLEMEGTRIRWRTNDSYIVEDEDLFEDEAAALARATEKAAEADREERQRVLTKEKDTRTWAWNASYHRKQIKEAQRQIEYHTAKLNVAAIKAKQDKAA